MALTNEELQEILGNLTYDEQVTLFKQLGRNLEDIKDMPDNPEP